MTTLRLPLPFVALLAFVLAAAPASACDFDIAFGPVHPPKRIAGTANAASYFIDLRARGGSPVGHSYVVMGVRTASGRERIVRAAGFYASMGPVGATASIVGAPGTVGYKKSDLGKHSVRFRRMVDRRTFVRIERLIGRMADTPGTFTMFANNCNAFVARVARALGIRTPRNTAMHAPSFLRKLVALNRRRK